MLGLLPHIHRSAHSDEHVEPVQRRDVLAPVQLNGGDGKRGGGEHGTERARILVRMVLQDEGVSEGSRRVVIMGGCRGTP